MCTHQNHFLLCFWWTLNASILERIVYRWNYRWVRCPDDWFDDWLILECHVETNAHSPVAVMLPGTQVECQTSLSCEQFPLDNSLRVWLKIIQIWNLALSEFVIKKVSHWTTISTPVTAGFPIPFSAMHSIVPDIVRLRTSTKWRRDDSKLFGDGLPLISHEIFGNGFPIASQTISKIEPSFTSIVPFGWVNATGASKCGKKSQKMLLQITTKQKKELLLLYIELQVRKLVIQSHQQQFLIHKHSRMCHWHGHSW